MKLHLCEARLEEFFLVFSQGAPKYLDKGHVLDSKDDRLALTWIILVPNNQIFAIQTRGPLQLV